MVVGVVGLVVVRVLAGVVVGCFGVVGWVGAGFLWVVRLGDGAGWGPVGVVGVLGIFGVGVWGV